MIAADENDNFIIPHPTLEHNPQGKVDAAVNDEDPFSIQLLLDELGDRWQFAWIKQRLQMMWPEINVAGRHVTNASCSRWTRSRLRVCTNLIIFIV